MLSLWYKNFGIYFVARFIVSRIPGSKCPRENFNALIIPIQVPPQVVNTACRVKTKLTNNHYTNIVTYTAGSIYFQLK